MGDPVDIIKDVGLNLVTGGLYSLVKAGIDTVETGNPMHLLSQGMDIGLSAVGNDVAGAIGGDTARMGYNLSGLAAGLAGGGMAGVASGGFGAESGVAPLAAETSGYVNAANAVPIAQSSGIAPEAAGYVNAVPGATSSAPGAVPGVGTTSSGLMSTVGDTTASGISRSEAQAAVKLINETGPGGVQKAVEGMSPAVKSALTMGGLFAGGQMLTGAMGGLFAGVSAEKQLELQQLINAQNQAQVQYKNKNNSYAPLLTFKQPPQPAGMVQQTGGMPNG